MDERPLLKTELFARMEIMPRALQEKLQKEAFNRAKGRHPLAAEFVSQLATGEPHMLLAFNDFLSDWSMAFTVAMVNAAYEQG